MDTRTASQGPQATGVAILFAGDPPRLDSVAALAESSGKYHVSHADPEARWAELLITGLTFDLVGLGDSPRAPADAPARTFGGLDQAVVTACHAALLDVGPHLRGAGGMVPVAKGMCALACALTELDGCVGVIWRPSGVAMTSAYFCDVINHWLAGGPFPALGLTALDVADDGAVVSTGLAHFVGRELRVLPADEPTAQRVKLAIRLISHIMETGDASEQTLVGPDGRTIVLRPVPAGTHIEAVQQGT